MMAAVMRSAADRERAAALGVSRFAAERHQVGRLAAAMQCLNEGPLPLPSLRKRTCRFPPSEDVRGPCTAA